MFSSASTIIRIGVFNNKIILYVVSAVLVDGNFRRHIDLKLSCYIVYLQTPGGEILLLI